MKRVFIVVLILGIGVTTIWWFLRPSVKAIAPPHSTLDSTLVCPVSTLTVPLIFKTKDLQRSVNEKVSKQIMQGWLPVGKRKRDSVFLEIVRTDSVRFTWKAGVLYTNVPLHIRCQLMKKVKGIRLINQKPIEAEVKLFVETKILIDKNWRIDPHTKLTKIVWRKVPSIKIGFINIPLKGIAGRYLDKNKDKLTQMLDVAFHKALDTRPVVEKLWNDIQKPIVIKKTSPQIGLKVDATDMSLKWVDAKAGDIEGLVTLSAHIYSWLDKAPVTTNLKLPTYKRQDSKKEKLALYILTRIPFSKLNDFANANLDKLNLSYANYKVEVKKSELYASDKGLALQLHLKGDVNGRLYLKADPYYDTVKQIVGLKNLHYDIDTEQALLKTADLAFHDQLISMVSDKLKMDLSSEIAQLPSLIENGIEKGKTGEKIDVFIDKLSATTYTMLITAKDIQWILKANGHASITLDRTILSGKKKRL